MVVLVLSQGLNAQETANYELLMILNQPAYVPGDTLYFHSLLMDQEGVLDQNRRIAKLSLTDELDNIENEINVLYERGISQNQIILPATLASTSYGLKITFHGPYYEQLQTVIPIPVITTEEPQSTLQPTFNKHQTSSPFQSSIRNQEIVTRDSVSLKLIPASSAADTAIYGLSINVINQSAFGRQINADQLVRGSTIELLTKPQARIILTGKAYNPITQSLLPDSAELVFYQQSTRRLYQSFVQKNGMVKLELLDFYGLDRLLVGANINGRLLKNVIIKWDQDQFVDTQESREDKYSSKHAYAQYRQKQIAINRSYEFFLNEDAFDVTQIAVPPINIKADVSYDLMKFIVFDDVPELVKTVINSLYYGIIDGEEVIRIKFLEETLTDQDPLFFIDGVATYDTQEFLSIPTTALKSLKIVLDKRKLIRFGALGNYGIVIVETNNPVPAGYQHHEIVTGLSSDLAINLTLRNELEAHQPYFTANGYWKTFSQWNASSNEGLWLPTTDDAGIYHAFISGYLMGKGWFMDTVQWQVQPK